VGNRKNRTVCNFCWSGGSLQVFFKHSNRILSLSSELKSTETSFQTILLLYLRSSNLATHSEEMLSKCLVCSSLNTDATFLSVLYIWQVGSPHPVPHHGNGLTKDDACVRVIAQCISNYSAH